MARAPFMRDLFREGLLRQVEKKSAKRNRREEMPAALAQMLESSDGSKRINDRQNWRQALAYLEAALYRHFPSKTKMV